MTYSTFSVIISGKSDIRITESLIKTNRSIKFSSWRTLPWAMNNELIGSSILPK